MPARPLGLPGFGGHYFFSNNALEDILYSISPLLYRKSGYFSRITAFRPVGHVFVWLAHLQLIYHLDFINNRKDVKKYILLHFLKKIKKIDAVVHKKTKFHANGHYTEFYNALWHQRAIYSPVLPGTDPVLLM